MNLTRRRPGRGSAHGRHRRGRRTRRRRVRRGGRAGEPGPPALQRVSGTDEAEKHQGGREAVQDQVRGGAATG